MENKEYIVVNYKGGFSKYIGDVVTTAVTKKLTQSLDERLSRAVGSIVLDLLSDDGASYQDSELRSLVGEAIKELVDGSKFTDQDMTHCIERARAYSKELRDLENAAKQLPMQLITMSGPAWAISDLKLFIDRVSSFESLRSGEKF